MTKYFDIWNGDLCRSLSKHQPVISRPPDSRISFGLLKTRIWADANLNSDISEMPLILLTLNFQNRNPTSFLRAVAQGARRENKDFWGFQTNYVRTSEDDFAPLPPPTLTHLLCRADSWVQHVERVERMPVKKPTNCWNYSKTFLKLYNILSKHQAMYECRGE